MIDTHCHLTLSPLKESWKTVWQNAQKAGVTHAINIGTDLNTSQEALRQAEEEPCLMATCGIHPLSAHDFDQKAQDVLIRLMQHPKIVAVGEVGLDAYRTQNLTQQQQCLRWFIEQALNIQKPLVIHVREAAQELKKILKDYPGIRGVIHCFTGTLEDAIHYLDMGFYLSFSGIITFKNAADLRDIVKIVPLDRILAETDSPYLAPVPHRGQTNTPAYVKWVVKTLADLKDESFENMENITSRNAKELFGF